MKLLRALGLVAVMATAIVSTDAVVLLAALDKFVWSFLAFGVSVASFLLLERIRTPH